MSRALAVALLAQGALAAVNIHYMPDLPEVTPAPTAVEIPGVNQLANIAAAAAATDAPGGLEACADAENLIQFCVTEIPNFTKAANSVIAACMCCSRSSYVAPLYSSCKSYITASAPQYTNDYTLVSIASSLCTAQGRGICSATGLASGTASATASSRTARSSITAASRPAACSSFASIIQSCSRKDDDFLSQSGRQQASCICYSGRTYTTKFDDYASSCASWARTGLSSGYSDIAELSTFCEDYPASRTTSRARGGSSDDDTTTAGSGGGGVGGSGGATTTPDNGPKSTVTVPPPTTTAPPRSPAARNAASGLVVLGAVFAGMLLA